MFLSKKKPNRLNPQQEKVEKEAIRLLKQAQELLEEDPRNAEEAKRIRFEVTHCLLPKQRMYIMGKHPRSLLKDLDRKINQAYASQILHDGELHEEEAPFIQTATTQRACEMWTNRYGETKNSVQKQLYWSIAIFFALTVFIVLLLYFANAMDGGSSFSRSFRWISR